MLSLGKVLSDNAGLVLDRVTKLRKILSLFLLELL